MKFSEKDKLENKLKNKKNNIGILGGSFDPAHKGHLRISLEAKKKLKLKKIFWTITQKNPFKKKAYLSLNKKFLIAKKLTNKYKFIKIEYLEDKLKTNKAYKLIKYLKKKNKAEIFFIMGADNLIKFHRWYKWKSILKICKVAVFDRHGFKKKAIKSVSYKNFYPKSLIFVNFKKVNISSSKLRKI